MRAATTSASERAAKSMRWQRDRTVGSSSSGASDSSRKCVRAGGSSRVFSSLLAAGSFMRSASVRTITFRSASNGLVKASFIISSIWSTTTKVPAGSTSMTSGWRAERARRQALQAPQPPSGQTRAAAKQRAASSTPEPRGPPAGRRGWAARRRAAAGPRPAPAR